MLILDFGNIANVKGIGKEEEENRGLEGGII